MNNTNMYRSDIPPNISIAQLENNKIINCKVKSLYTADITKNHTLFNSGICYAKNIKLPKNILSQQDTLSDKNLYNAIFLIATGNGWKQCNIYIIDNNNIDVYYCKLPSLSKDFTGTYAIHSQKYGLIAIGSDNYSNNNCFEIL